MNTKNDITVASIRIVHTMFGSDVPDGTRLSAGNVHNKRSHAKKIEGTQINLDRSFSNRNRNKYNRTRALVLMDIFMHPHQLTVVTVENFAAYHPYSSDYFPLIAILKG
jgi:hypothetical protein